jgi:hypothetical protein
LKTQHQAYSALRAGLAKMRVRQKNTNANTATISFTYISHTGEVGTGNNFSSQELNPISPDSCETVVSQKQMNKQG